MTLAWWLYLAAFIFGIAMVVMGIIWANTTMVMLGLIIGIALFFARRHIQQ